MDDAGGRMPLPPLSFRWKILLALVGTVVLLAGSGLLAIRQETQAQINSIIDRTTERAARAFTEVEQLRNEEMDRLGRRFAASVRLAAALDAAVEDGEPELLAVDAEYEAQLANLDRGLLGFTGPDGREIALLRDGRPVPPVSGASVSGASISGEGPADRRAVALLESGEEVLRGYRLFEGQLYSVQVHRVDLFGLTVGTLTLGFPLDDAVAARLGEVVGAETCFLVEGRCVAGDAGLLTAGLPTAGGEPLLVERDGARAALVALPLPGGGEAGVSQVLGVPLDDVLSPFERIQGVVRTAGVGALLFAVLIGLVLSRGLAGPVRTLVAATERVRRGEYDFEVQVASRDEMGTLADAFNEMIGDLALKERYRGVLDKVVSRDVAEELLKGEIRLGGENREVTTLFADVRGFTALTEGMGSREVVAMLNEWFDLCARAVEEEGGVVDKFMGDGVMAIFGAPMDQPDHADRTVRAAVRMRSDLEALNVERERRGDLPIRVGIGIATGEVVAGNTGSRDRLNYTVLGGPVNLASRLCSEAGPGEILVSDTTREALRDHGGMSLEPQEPRSVKGLTREVRPWLVRAATAALVAALALAGVPGSAAAQSFLPDPPTLVEAGVWYASSTGRVQIYPSGRFDFELFAPGPERPWMIPETDAFPAGRLRVFVDGFVGERVYATVEARADRGATPQAGSMDVRLQQAFVRTALTGDGGLHLQAGKFVSPFGNHPARHRTSADPFIRPPLHYDHRTALDPNRIPQGADDLLGWKDGGAAGRAAGAPVIWETPYPTGLMLLGTRGRAQVRLAWVNSAPSSEPDRWSPTADGPFMPSLVAHAGFQLLPELHLGASYNKGPYLRPEAQETFPEPSPGEPGGRIDTYDQELLSLEATATRGRYEARAEVVFDGWQLSGIDDDATDLSWFLEGKAKSGSGLYGALRYGQIRFGTLEASDGTEEAWDYDVSRWQLAGGYRLSRNLELRAEYMLNRSADVAGPESRLFSTQLWWRF